MRTDAFERLADHFGLAAEYEDVTGTTRPIGRAARRALLRALGVPDEPGAAEETLARVLDAEWRRVLPPVIVSWEDEVGIQTTACLPDAQAGAPVPWSLHEEGGAIHRGELDPASLGALETRTIDGAGWTRRALTLPAPLGPGYHRLTLGPDDAPLASATLLRAPRRCFTPAPLREGGRTFGIATQLPAVRSARNWGIGDFTDLTRLVELAADQGAGTLVVPPLHALFPGRPGRCNPYAPSSRRFLNLLHVDVEKVPELAESPELRALIEDDAFQARLRALRSAPLIDGVAVAQAKQEVLEGLFRHFRERHLIPGGPRASAFRHWCTAQGEALTRFARFQALSEHFRDGDGVPTPWTAWPEPYRDPDSAEVAAFAEAHAERVELHRWVQWIARNQVQGVGRRSWELRLAVGLCQDLAVGVAPDGADAWAERGLYLEGVGIGAPPDDFNAHGQDWGVLPWHPQRLRETGYAPFAATLRASMSDAGALRIDHAMGLMRLWWVPEGEGPRAGGYVAYPFEEMLAVLTLESSRNQCLVIGEDLGTVPAGLREALDAAGVLSWRLLYFERGPDGDFLPPAQYAAGAAVSVGTHDLPTLAGFWQGTDLEVRRELGLLSDDDYGEALVARAHDRAYLFLALDREGLLPEGMDVDPVSVPELTPALVAAVHRYLARTPSRVALAQTTDLLGQTAQVNLPGAGEAYPSWRQRQPLELEAWRDDPRLAGALEALREERGAVLRPGPAQEVEATHGGGALIPRATYRLQLHAGFGFRDAAALVPYLADLGISHCYFSPYLEARPGSTHGYDVVAHDRLNPELGTPEDFRHLCTVLDQHGMGQILDMVPNHVGIMGHKNRWWLDVLENGPASAYADFFDIDWAPLKEELRGKVLVPILGDHYGNLLDRGELNVRFEDGGFHVAYYEHRFPIDPREYPAILAPGLERLRTRMGLDDPDLPAFESLVTAFANLPARWKTGADAVSERRRDKELHKARLAELIERNADLAWYVSECLRELNGAEDYPADTARLHGLLERQAYRLAHWRVAADEINYRRFFDINDLAALRMENPEAFEATHALVLGLVAEGCLAGLRIDHPDGLYDPAEYFRRIQGAATAPRGPNGTAGPQRPIYLVAEKILTGEERLPEDWPVHGTTGYDFAALVDGLLVDRRGVGTLTRGYDAFIGAGPSLAEEAYQSRKLVMQNLLSSELHVLASELSRIAEADPHTRDFTLDSLRKALMEVVACFPVYRTYITAAGVSDDDREHILSAVSGARARSGFPDLSVLDFVREVLLTTAAEGKAADYRERVIRFAMKFQQYTGPVMAKGMEDTAFYRFHRLVSLNEVGGEPDRPGRRVADFHRACLRRREHWPHAMLSGSTHDSKRSEDVRARLHLLSEMPEAWRARVERWGRDNARFETRSGGRSLPDANTEYLFYQTLAGVWPLQDPDAAGLAELRERVGAYMEKAVKEAKVHTAWTNPDQGYEAALAAYVARVMDPDRNPAFFEDFLPFVHRLARLGLYNSLSATLLRLTAPGVPDVYQGTELWDFSLVDPDNRRPVDFERRRALLADLEARVGGDSDAAAEVRGLAERLEDGAAKQFLIWRALALRRRHPDLFEQGRYVPLQVQGPHRERLCAFARVHGEQVAVTLAPRLLAGEGLGAPFTDAGWSATFVAVPRTPLVDVLTGAPLPAAEPGGEPFTLPAGPLLRRFPVGLLANEDLSHG